MDDRLRSSNHELMIMSEAPKKILPDRKRYLEKYEDVRKQWRDAILGAFIAVFTIFVITYAFSYFSDNVISQYINLMEIYSAGQGVNEVMGFWALSYTPVSALNIVSPEWMDEWYMFLAPALVAGLIISVFTKSLKYSLVGGLWFVIFAMILPLFFVIMVPLFGSWFSFETINPMSLNAMLLSIFQDVLAENAMVAFFNMTLNSPFLGWCMAGALELGGVVILFSIPFSAIFTILKQAVRGRI